jgi:hypothetical protein
MSNGVARQAVALLTHHLGGTTPEGIAVVFAECNDELDVTELILELCNVALAALRYAAEGDEELVEHYLQTTVLQLQLAAGRGYDDD